MLRGHKKLKSEQAANAVLGEATPEPFILSLLCLESIVLV